MFIAIPKSTIPNFPFAQFCAHVVDHSPVYAESRSAQRLGCKALDAIDAAVDGVAEMPADVCALLQRAAESAPLPRLMTGVADGKGGLVPGTMSQLPARAYVPFFEAIEQAKSERPVVKAETIELAEAEAAADDEEDGEAETEAAQQAATAAE